MVTGVSFEWLATGRGTLELNGQCAPAAHGMLVDDPEELLVLQGFRACTASGKRAVVRVLAEQTALGRAHVYVEAGAVRRLRLPAGGARRAAKEEDDLR